jgi:hypothetical protein
MSDQANIEDQDATIGGGDSASPDRAQLWQELEKEENGSAAAADHGAASDDVAQPDSDPSQAQESRDASEEDVSPTETTPGDEQSPGGAMAAPSEPDIWDNASPEQREAFERLKAEKDDLANRRSGQDRKIRDLNLALMKLSARPAPSKTTDGADGNTEPIDLGEKWGDFKEEYPEVAGPIEQMLAEQGRQINALSGQLSSMGQTAIQSVIRDNESRLDERFPGWAEIAGSQEFGKWASTQSRMVQDALRRNANAIVDYDDAADILQRFKDATGWGTTAHPNATPVPDPASTTNPSKRRDRQLTSTAGRAPKRGAAVATGIPEDGDREMLWNMWEKAGF